MLGAPGSGYGSTGLSQLNLTRTSKVRLGFVAVNFGAKALRIHHIFGVKTLPFWCQIVTIKSGLVRERDTFWCENEIFHFSGLGAKT